MNLYTLEDMSLNILVVSTIVFFVCFIVANLKSNNGNHKAEVILNIGLTALVVLVISFIASLYFDLRCNAVFKQMLYSKYSDITDYSSGSDKNTLVSSDITYSWSYDSDKDTLEIQKVNSDEINIIHPVFTK